MGRNAGDPPNYFLCNSVQEALEGMEGRYDDPYKTFGVIIPVVYDGRRKLKDPVLMDHVLGPRDGAVIVRIGVAGKIWALMSLWPKVRRPKERVRWPKEIARILLAGTDREVKETRVVHLAALLSAKESLDKESRELTIEEADALLEIVISAIAQRLCGTSFSERETLDSATLPNTIRLVLSRDHRTPQDCARSLIEELDLGELLVVRETPSTLPHHIDPGLQLYINSVHSDAIRRDQDIENAIKSIGNVLGYAGGRSGQAPAVVLSGPEQAGKKAVVGDLLRGLKLTEPRGGYPQTDQFGNPAPRLPVLALRLRSSDYPTMASEILAFLTRVVQPDQRKESIATLAAQFRNEFCKGDAMDAIIQKIREVHRERWAASMMIFLDAHELGRDSLSRVLQRSGLFRVLEALATSNPDSRILLTATDLNKFWPPTLDQPTPVAIKLPTLSRLRWYLSSEAEKQFVTKDGDRRTIESRLTAQNQKVMSGDVLLALSVILSVGRTSADTFCKLIDDLPVLDAKIGGTIPVGYGDPVFAHLVEQLDTLGVLPAVALIAATRITSDALTETSLNALIEKFTSPAPRIPVADVKKQLKRLAKAAQTLFISLGPHSRVDPDELGFGENGAAHSQAWSISNVIAMAIMRQLQAGKDGVRKDWPVIKQNALRLVAIAARRRAQLKRIRRAEDARVRTH